MASGWIKPIEAGEHDVEVEVEHARSGRSQCRACNTFIKQGELRLGIEVEMPRRAPGQTTTSWRHLKCFHAPRGFHIDRLLGFSQLEPKDKKAVLRRLRELMAEEHAVATAKPAPLSRTRSGTIAARGVAGRHAAALEALHHAHPGDARFTLSPPGNATAMLKKYNSMSAAELKEVLRANEQQLTGKKAELVACCVDGELHGGLPICPNCERGRLHAPGEDGVYTCPGYWDKDAAMPIHCPFEATSVTRTKWVMPGGEESTALPTPTKKPSKKKK